MASECEISVESFSSDTSNKIKKPNWTELERKILVEEVHLRENILFGKFKGAGGGKIAKDVAWREVAQAVNGYVYLQVQLLFCFREFPRCHMVSTDKYRIKMATDCYDASLELDVYFTDAIQSS